MSEDSAAVTGVMGNKPGVIRPGTKVLIIGFASSSRNLAPIADKSYDVFSLNHNWEHIPNDRWSQWFEMHPRDHVLKDVIRGGQTMSGTAHYQWLSKEPKDGRTIWMQEHFPEIPASKPWPRDEINRWLASEAGYNPEFYAHDYITSSISQMLLSAMMQGYEEIAIYGVDLLQEEEWFYQRAGCEYLIGLARGRGHKVFIPKECALLKASYVYGYSELPDKERNSEVVQYIKKVAKQIEEEQPKIKNALDVTHATMQMSTVIRDNWIPKAVERGMNQIGWNGPSASLDAACREDVEFAHGVALGLHLTETVRRAMLSFNEEQLKRSADHRSQLIQQIGVVQGQLAAYDCSVSWLGHVDRGGKLGDDGRAGMLKAQLTA